MTAAVGATIMWSGPAVFAGDTEQNGPAANTSRPASTIGAGLEQAAGRALAHYPSLMAAEADLQAAGQDVRTARWGRWPSASLDVVARSDGDGFEPRVDVTQPLWTGGRIRGGVLRAEAFQGAAAARVEELRQDLLIQVTNAYFDHVRGQRLQAIYIDSLNEHRRLLDTMTRRVQQEVSPNADLELARARTALVEQDLAAAEGQTDAARRRLVQLTGDANGTYSPPVYSPELHHSPPSDAGQAAVACSPTLRRLASEADAAEAERMLARSAAVPEVGLRYSYDRLSGSVLGLVLRTETTGGLAPLSNARAAQARAFAADQQVLTAERLVLEAVALDLVENTSARRRIEGASAFAESTANVTASYLRQFTAGRRTWLDVMNAVREGVTARVGLADAQISAMASAARLEIRTCRWPSVEMAA
ncbi:MAG: TolC family protein [Brevundimonas sp.]